MNLILGDCLTEMKKLSDNSIDSIVTDPPYGWSFMGKTWDYDIPKVEVWKEVLRILKPGAHALIACGTRTQHRMAVNIEDAGFEIRDIVAWVYGSGFPKSLNIGKMVDKLLGNKRELVSEQKRKGRSAGILGKETDIVHINDKGTSKYEGWGTALKPAMELWTLARKPLSEKTVAENALKWGTGGINIDGGRIEAPEGLTKGGCTKYGGIFGSGDKVINPEGSPLGRFPANFIHDGSEEVVGLFPETKSELMKQGQKRNSKPLFGNKTDYINEIIGDSGSASRFFYCAKASKAERNRGLEGFEEKISGTNAKGYIGDGIHDIKPRVVINQNFHPTVKPVSLMRYLVKLITPKNGIVLDPFMGSGTTGIACKLEGFDFTGIEIDEEYLKISEARINGNVYQYTLF